MSKLDLEHILLLLKATAEETRLRILALFRAGELTVTELVTILRQSQPRVSRHLRLLCEAGILERYREGTWIFYRLTERDQEGRLARLLMDFIPYEDPIFQLDQKRLEDVRATRRAKASEYFKQNAQRWDEIRSLYIAEEQVEEKLLELTEDMKIEILLDVGTGTGRILEIFSDRIKSGIGVDLSREMLTMARDKIDRENIDNCQVRQGDMYDLALSDSSIDLVLFHQVLHFADEPLMALKETYRLLKQGGRVIIVDFAPHDLEYLREEHAHLHLGIKDEDMVSWFKQVGFTAEPVRHLRGEKLDLLIWLAHKRT